MNIKRYNVVFLLTHPIQYFSPLFREMAKHPQIDLTVYYCSDESIRGVKDSGFGREIKWDIPLFQGYKYKFLKNYSLTPTIFKPPFGLINFGIIREIIKKRHDALIIHGWTYFTLWIAYLTSILRKTPVFIRAESPLNQELLKPKWKILLKKVLFGFFFKRISGFLSIGTENREFYKYYGVSNDKIFLTPYAVDNRRFIESYEELIGDKEKIRKEIGLPSDKVIVLFSGKLIEKKRPMDLLMAYEKIKLGNKALVFVGDGRLRKELEEYAKNKKLKDVYFAGFKNQSELPRFYVVSDIFLLPSTVGETWGLVVNEAMCFHMPIIVSDIVGCGKDLIKHGENGYIFSEGDISKLAEYLEDLIVNKEKRRKFGEKSFEIIQGYSYEKDIEGILRALKSIER